MGAYFHFGATMSIKKSVYQILICFTLIFTSSAFHHCADQSSDPQNMTSEQVKGIIAEKAKEILTVLKKKNFSNLSEYVHPEKGVRISPYGYIDPENDREFKPQEIKQINQDSTFFWGYEDGTGDSIKLSIADYFDNYVYDAKFLQVKKVGYQEIIQKGNTKINISEVYPKAIFVEYHFSGTDKHDGFDWRSLRLIFEKKDDTWYLVGISHDQWTI